MRIAEPGWITERILLLGREESNVYLLKGEENTLVGGGMITIVPDVLEQLDAFGIDTSAITRMLILHSHFDHCGTAPFFAKRWPQLKVVASKRGKEMLANPKVVESISFLSRSLIAESSMEEQAEQMGLTFDGVEVQETVEGGERVNWGGIELEIIDAPGHSSDSIAVYMPSEKALFASDAGGIPFGEDVFAAGNSNFTKYQQTLERFNEYDVEIHLAEHYGAFTGEEAKRFMPRSIEAARETRELMEESYRRTGDAEKSTEELTELIMKRAPEYFLPREVMAMVIGQMMRHIAKSQTGGQPP
jgi:glyoxylase-like metal-dependent hydrolase (beta-lactamase superfamily II)